MVPARHRDEIGRRSHIGPKSPQIINCSCSEQRTRCATEFERSRGTTRAQPGSAPPREGSTAASRPRRLDRGVSTAAYCLRDVDRTAYATEQAGTKETTNVSLAPAVMLLVKLQRQDTRQA